MSTNKETPEEGHESTDIDVDGFPLRDAPDEELAVALAEQKEEARDAVDAVNWSLLDSEKPLTQEKVRNLSEVADALAALSRTLSGRVPDEHRAKTEEEYQEMYGGG